MAQKRKRIFPELLETDRLRLRPLKPEFAAPLFETVERERNRLGAFLPWIPTIQTVEDERAYLIECDERRREGSFFDYGVFLKSTDEHLGNVGVVRVEGDEISIGYWLKRSFEGQGFVLEAVKELERAASDLGFRRIRISCSPVNTRSIAVAERLGYVLDAKESERVSYLKTLS